MKILLGFLFLSLPVFVQAQGVKHPRVLELEARIHSDLRSIISSRFPDSPSLISVDIAPLRRVSESQGPSEGLPYYDFVEVEIIDEWDDPKVSIYQLLSRVRQVKVKVSLPDSLADNDVNELKDIIYQSFKLIPGRDEVLIERRPWAKSTRDYSLWFIAVGLLAIFLLGLYVVMRLSLPKAGSAAPRQAAESSGTSGGAMAPLQLPQSASSKGSMGSGEHMSLKVNDTLKLKEFIFHTLTQVAESKSFPSLEDMLVLEELGTKNPSWLGGILMSFSEETRKRVFALSSSPLWLEALHNPGDLVTEVVSTAEHLMRNRSVEKNPLWEEVLIRVWRLNEGMPEFLRGLDREEAFCVLNDLPKSVSLPAARKAFPGGWGVLLDPNFKPKLPSKDELSGLIYKLKMVQSDREISLLEQYKKDKELLKYLLTCGDVEEREVYEASPKESLIHTLRPPFYLLLEQPSEVLKGFLYQFTIDQWAVALFNVSRDARKPLEGHFNEKEKMLFIQRLKSFDRSPPDREMTGSLREEMGRRLFEFLKQRNDAPATHHDTTAETDHGEPAAA